MAWNRRYSLISHVRSSLWIVPLFAVMSAMILKRVAVAVGDWLINTHGYDIENGFLSVSADEAHAILDRIFTLNLSCLVFTFSSLLVAIQIAGGQYTPRIIATTLLRNNVIRWVVGLFVFSMLWTHRTMTELGQGTLIPQLQVALATAIGLASLVAFILLIDYSARLLRPVSLVGRVAELGFTVIRNVYPDKLSEQGDAALSDDAAAAEVDSARMRREPANRVDCLHGRSGVVLAVNLPGLVREAQRADCFIEFAVQVGDFVATDEPLFYLYGNSWKLDGRRLENLVAFGSERTMEQDPMFAFRIEVDIALKALSPAINDPTTAVLAIDQLHRLLGMVGKRSLANREIYDESGQPRVAFYTPDWEDYVHMCFREIRMAGAGSIQIGRRLRAMIDNLTMTLPASHHAALRCERDLLDAAIEREQILAEDAILARIGDTQGLGGSSVASSARNRPRLIVNMHPDHKSESGATTHARR
ncbi:DUF2254 domain-containing protein [Paraburkholderia sacchari]|uniref:DUF2254 domain-containing protein n=1 Tax=Paraburkholderia sacchari TaxID=159450 RepID=A0A8T6ZEM0_9BURK|nr:DUF2254 domain-containing protein [Paraburkholderia sacchari]NLP62720.1 DUF2254 domain-containing protein [Paraburkholderia sacchari]